MIVIDKLSKKYGKQIVLNEVSLCANPSEVVGIVGGNGTGKTTILSILAGLVKADSGSIKFFSSDASKKGVTEKFCSYIPQENPLYGDMTVYDNMALLMAGRDVKRRVRNVAGQYGLLDKISARVNTLSGGMKRRIPLACALSENKPILLMDEPTVALDSKSREIINHWIMEHKKKSGIVLISTHEEEEIRLCDRVYELTDGRLYLKETVTDGKNDIPVQV